MIRNRYEYIHYLKERIVDLETIISNKNKSLAAAPKGSLRVSSSKKHMDYYHITQDNKPKGKYIPKKKAEFIRMLAQKDYDKKVLKAAREELSFLLNLLDQVTERGSRREEKERLKTKSRKKSRPSPDPGRIPEELERFK